MGNFILAHVTAQTMARACSTLLCFLHPSSPHTMPYLAPNPEHIVPVSPAGSSKAVATVMMPPPIDFDDEEEPPRIPTVVLDVDEIADDMAARMATSLLGHVLFLKGQIPLCVPRVPREATCSDQSAVLCSSLRDSRGRCVAPLQAYPCT